MDGQRRLVVPLQDVEACIHTLEYISAEGAKRFLAGGAKRGHFSVLGAEPFAIGELSGPLLICEGWATGASLYLATGHAVIAAGSGQRASKASASRRSRSRCSRGHGLLPALPSRYRSARSRESNRGAFCICTKRSFCRIARPLPA